MNRRTMLVIPLALVCGLSAVFLVKALRAPAAPAAVKRVDVVFVAQDVATGETLAAPMVELRPVPVDQVPDDAVLKLADAVDRAARTSLDKGDILRSKKLADKGSGRGMAALVREGMRAFTIQTPSFSSSVAGFLLPGNRVDVLLTAENHGEEAKGPMTWTLLGDVEILAVHTVVSSPSANKIDPDDARSVTLSVTPEDAQRLDLGQKQGTLHLSLRNPHDKQKGEITPSTLADLQGGATPPAPPVEAPKVAEGPEAPARTLRPGGSVTVVLARTMRGTQLGRQTLQITVPPHESLAGYSVATPYGTYRLDDSLVVQSATATPAVAASAPTRKPSSPAPGPAEGPAIPPMLPASIKLGAAR